MAKGKNFKKDQYVIVVISPEDKYELPLKIYTTYQEMANDLKITISKVYNLIQTGSVFRQTNLRYLKVRCDY